MFTLKEIEKKTNDFLSQGSLEELLEKFDLTPTEVFMRLYQDGLIDDDILEELEV